MPAAGRYTVLTGEYQIRNPKGQQPRPDGDTIKFVVDSPKAVKKLQRFGDVAPDIGKTGGIKLRLEVIDTLETHYPTNRGRGIEVRQRLDLANAARDTLVELLGFTNVVFNEDSTVKSADDVTVRGYILANGIEKNGRVVGFAYAGEQPPAADKQVIRLEPQLMNSSANIQILQQGLAYATLYQTLPFELIQAARKIAGEARDRAAGVFGAEDIGVDKFAPIVDIAALQELVVMPKLFRRLADFLVITGDALSEFDEWIRDNGKDDDLILPSGEVGNLHDLYEVNDNGISLRVQPEDVQFLD
jgi:endonuclease YncB( thermonuclease family)